MIAFLLIYIIHISKSSNVHNKKTNKTSTFKLWTIHKTINPNKKKSKKVGIFTILGRNKVIP